MSAQELQRQREIARLLREVGQEAALNKKSTKPAKSKKKNKKVKISTTDEPLMAEESQPPPLTESVIIPPLTETTVPPTESSSNPPITEVEPSPLKTIPEEGSSRGKKDKMPDFAAPAPDTTTVPIRGKSKSIEFRERHPVSKPRRRTKPLEFEIIKTSDIIGPVKEFSRKVVAKRPRPSDKSISTTTAAYEASERRRRAKVTSSGKPAEGEITAEILDQLEGRTVPVEEKPGDPVRKIIDEGVQAALRAAGLEDENYPFEAHEEVEAGEIATSPPPTTKITTPTADEMVDVASMPRTSGIILGMPPTVPLPPPLTETTVAPPESTAADCSKSKGKEIAGEQSKSKHWRSRISHKPPPPPPPPPALTLETIAADTKDLNERYKLSVQKLYKDLNSVDERSKDSFTKLKTFFREKMTNLEDRLSAEFARRKKEDDAAKERMDYMNTAIDSLLASQASQQQQYPPPQQQPASQAGPSGTAPEPNEEMMWVGKKAFCQKYRSGYEDCLLKCATKGVLKQEVMHDMDIIRPGLVRYDELWSIMCARQSPLRRHSPIRREERRRSASPEYRRRQRSPSPDDRRRDKRRSKDASRRRD